MNRVKRWSVGLFSTVLIASGMLAGQSPAPARAASTDPYVLIAGDVACDASELTSATPTVDLNSCQQGATSSLWDPNYRKPSGTTGVGYFNASGTGVYGSDPSRIVVAGDVQYNDGWRDSFDYANTSGSIDPDTFCAGQASAAGPHGSCSFDQTWQLAASQNTALSARVNDGVLATPGDHEWQGGTAESATCTTQTTFCPYDSKRNWTNCTFLVDSTKQACGFQSYFKYTAANVFAPASTYYDPDNTWGSYVNKVNCSGTGCSPLTIIFPDTGACTGALAGQNLCGTSGAVTTWLKSAIADSTANPDNACTIVVNYAARYADFHHGDTTGIQGLIDAMYPYNATTNPGGYHGTDAQQPDLVVSGHDHGYERLKRVDRNGNVVTTNAGIRQITVGTGGLTTETQPANSSGLFPPGNSAWQFDYWKTGSTTVPQSEATDPGVLHFSWDQSAATWTATHYYMLDDASNTLSSPQNVVGSDGVSHAGTPHDPIPGDSVTGNCHV